MVGFQIYFEGRADKICRFADGFLMRCEENEESDDFRSKQLVVTIYRNVEGSLQEKFREANQLISFGYVELPLRHSREDGGGN